MCTVLLPPGGYPTAVHKYIISYYITTVLQLPTVFSTECYNKVPKSVVKSELGGKSVEKWQRDWDQTSKGQTTKE
jgi:hypothetical protein